MGARNKQPRTQRKTRMAEYFVGANVYQRLNWVLDRIQDQQKKVVLAEAEIQRLRKTALKIVENHENEDIAIWFAEENGRRLGL